MRIPDSNEFYILAKEFKDIENLLSNINEQVVTFRLSTGINQAEIVGMDCNILIDFLVKRKKDVALRMKYIFAVSIRTE